MSLAAKEDTLCGGVIFLTVRRSLFPRQEISSCCDAEAPWVVLHDIIAEGSQGFVYRTD